MDGKADVNQILFEPMPELWRRARGRPCSSWLQNITNDLFTFDRVLLEATDAARERSSWRLLAYYSAMHSLWCMMILDWIGSALRMSECRKEMYLYSTSSHVDNRSVLICVFFMYAAFSVVCAFYFFVCLFVSFYVQHCWVWIFKKLRWPCSCGVLGAFKLHITQTVLKEL